MKLAYVERLKKIVLGTLALHSNTESTAITKGIFWLLMVHRHEQTKPNKQNQHVLLEASVKNENVITHCSPTVRKIINAFFEGSKIN